MEFDWIEWYGYLASLVVFISLTMSSIIKLRIFNFIGCLIFAHYGLLTGLLPVTVANLSIALINIYYLYTFPPLPNSTVTLSHSNEMG